MLCFSIYALFSAVEETFTESIEESGDARCLDARWWRMGLAQAKVKVFIQILDRMKKIQWEKTLINMGLVIN